MAEKLQFDLDIATKQAQSDLKAAAKEAKTLGEDLEDTRSNADKVADAIRAIGQKAADDLRGAQAAADALAQAMGPELASKAEQGQGGIDGIVDKLKAVGLTYDEIRGDADKFAAAIRDAESAVSSVQRVETSVKDVGDAAKLAEDDLRRMDSAADGFSGVKQGTKDVQEGFKGVARESDNTRSVVANFTGNAASSLPGVANAFGPLNQAIGQFGEYAAEGNIRLANFVAAAAPIAAVALVMGEFADQAKRAAEIRAFDKKQLDEYTKALRAGKTEVEAIVDAYEDLGGKIEIVTGHADDLRDGFNAFETIKSKVDIADKLDAAGVSVQQFAQVISQGEPAFDAFQQYLQDTGVSGEDQKLIMQGVYDQTQKVAQAAENAEKWERLFGQAIDETTGKTKGQTAEGERWEAKARAMADTTRDLTEATDGASLAMGEQQAAVLYGTPILDAAARTTEDHATAAELARIAQDALKDSVKDASDAIQENVDKLRADIDAQNELTDTLRAAADQEWAVADATDDYNQYLQDLKTSVAEAKGDHEKLNGIYRDGAGKAQDLADATVTLKVEQDKVLGVTTSAATKMDLWNSSMVGAAKQASGPLRTAILDHIGAVNGIPDEKMTEIQALIDQGKLDEANYLLALASKAREASIKADVDETSLATAEAKLRNLERNRTANVFIQQRMGAGYDEGPKRAVGGPVLPGVDFTVGENGPEVVRFDRPGTVIPNHKLDSWSAPTGVTVNFGGVTINTGTDANAFAAMLRFKLSGV